MSPTKIRNRLSKLIRSVKRVQSGATRVNAPGREQGSEWYDQSFYKAVHWKQHYTQSRYYFLWSAIADRLVLSGASSILDIGCGPGQFASLLRDRGIRRYWGIDFSGARIAQARQVCPEFEFYQEDAFTTSRFDQLDYDCVAMTEVLEHVEEDRHLIARIRPGSRLLATVPNFPYESHVRHFIDREQVQARYAGSVNSLRVDEFLENEAGKTYFLIDGIVPRTDKLPHGPEA